MQTSTSSRLLCLVLLGTIDHYTNMDQMNLMYQFYYILMKDISMGFKKPEICSANPTVLAVRKLIRVLQFMIRDAKSDA